MARAAIEEGRMSQRQMRRAREREIERQARRGSRLAKKAALGGGVAIGATVLFAPGAQAATFTVSNLNDSGDGSLRDAIDDANAAAGLDQVTFASGLSGTITLTTGAIYIQEQANVQGPGASVLTVSGDDASRIFYVYPSVNGAEYDPVNISGLTLVHGDPGDDEQGGAVRSEYATLTLSGMVFDDNYAEYGGGAVYSDEGKLIVTDSLFTRNVVNYGEGGAIYVDNTQDNGAVETDVTITGSVFTDNTNRDGPGGALYFDAEGGILIDRTTVSGNHSPDGDAGGIYIDDVEDGDVQILNSTISGNNAFYGGGMQIGGVEGSVTIANTTVSGNTAAYDGGGIVFDYLAQGETTTIQNSTIVGNAAGANPGDFTTHTYGGGGIFLYDSSDDADDNGPVTISSSIIANNTSVGFGNDLGLGTYAEPFVVGFSIFGEVGRKDSVVTPGVTENPAGSNQVGVDPQLGPLANNGGPTQTLLPALTSPAIDGGVANGLAIDQRGLPRTADLTEFANHTGSDGTDIGAVEIAGAPCKDTTALAVSGTDGNDTLAGSDHPETISGLAGDDTADGAGGNDCVSGDDGKDTAKGGPGNDQVSGGDGKDKARGQGGKDTVKGGAGKDNIAGGGGKDKLKGNGGKDTIKSRDGAKDKVNCGGGEDKAIVDDKDKVSGNCETVS